MRRVKDKLLNLRDVNAKDRTMVKFRQCYQCIPLGFGPWTGIDHSLVQ